MNSSFNSDVPGWDGNPSTFLAFEVACKWFEKTLKETERRGAAARVWSRLSGSARSVVKHLSAEDFDCAGGLDKLLQVLRASPLQSLPIPDSFAKLEKWHQLRRRDQESIPELLVREDELFLELQQSLVRSRARKRPATTLTGSPGAGATTGDGASTPASPTSAKKKEDDAEDEPATAETPAKDTGFFDNELRGFRLLKAAGITYAERQQVLTLTDNSVAFEKIRQALRALFDESEPSLRRAKPRNYWLEGEDLDSWGHGDDGWYETSWDDGWEDEEAYWQWPEETQPDENEDTEPKDEEESALTAQESEASVLAAEANRTLAEARAAVQRVRSARGYFPLGGKGHGKAGKASPKGKGLGKKGPGKYSAKGSKGKGCLICGQTGHFWRECPRRQAKGKGKTGTGKGAAALWVEPLYHGAHQIYMILRV